jgi:glycosyltransferase involved in cell wall biosynthesis
VISVISVIVPVYNVEKFLSRCIDSILAQTFTDFECILVDDGSPDRCPEICDAYAARDERILVIHQVNGGTAAARQAGVNSAQGTLISFVDSDDWIEPNALELLYNKQQETDAYVVMGGVTVLYEWNRHSVYFSEIPEDENMLMWLFRDAGPRGHLWGKLYKKALFDTCWIPDFNFGEDCVVIVQLLTKLIPHNVQMLQSLIYNYDRSGNGITKQVKMRREYRSFSEYPPSRYCVWVEQYLDETKQDEQIKSLFKFWILNEIITYIRVNTKITKTEIAWLYSKYYINCDQKNIMRIDKRILIPLLYRSFLLGRCYIFILEKLGILYRAFRQQIRR